RRGRAAARSPWSWSVPATMLRLLALARWSGPSTRSRMARARSPRGPAAASSPWSCYYGQVAQAGSSVRIVGPPPPLLNSQGALQERPGEGKLAPRPEVARDWSQQPARGQGRHLSIAHPPEHHLRVREQAGAVRPPFGVRGVGGKGSSKQVDGCDQPPLAHISR